MIASISVDITSSEEQPPSQAPPPRRLLTRKSTFRLDKESTNATTEDSSELNGSTTSLKPFPVVPEIDFSVKNDVAQKQSVSPKLFSPSVTNRDTEDENNELILDVQLLRESFEVIRPNGLQFVKQFYITLFAHHPPLHQLFARFDQNHIEKKLLNILVMIVENIENEEILSRSLSDLGRKHVGIGVIPPYFKVMGDALIKSMALYFHEAKSDIWHNGTEKSWRSAYSIVAGIMIESMASSSKMKNSTRRSSLSNTTKSDNFLPQSVDVADLKKTADAMDYDDYAMQARNLRQRTRIVVNGKVVEPVKKLSPRSKTLAANKTQKSIFLKVKQAFLDSMEKVVSWDTITAYTSFAYKAFTNAPTWAVVLGIFLIYLFFMRILPDTEWVNQLVHSIDEISLLIGVILYIKEAPDRRKQFHYHAWGAIDGASSNKVSQTRIMALQDLNNDGVSLRGFHGVGSDISELRVPGADLRQCHLTDAKIDDGDLSGADLSYATISHASLVRANLTRAKLDFAAFANSNCNGATFECAQLFCVDFTDANLSGVNFRNASLKGVCFEHAVLAGADFTGADVDVRALQKGVLSSTRMPDGTLSP